MSFIDSTYRAKIQDYARQPVDPKEAEQVAALVLERVFTFKEESNAELSSLVARDVKELAGTRPGIDLFKRALSKGGQFCIWEGDGQYFSSLQEISIPKKEKYPYLALNDAGERTIQQGPRSIYLAHELGHAVHNLENPEAFNARTHGKNLIDEKFEDEEEQLNITGYEKTDSDALVLKDIVNENSFLAAFNLPPRFNHQGPKDYTLTDIIQHRAFGSIKPYLTLYPSSVNELQTITLEYPTHQETLQLYPLTIAAHSGHIDMIDFLLSQGANLNGQDEMGGMLHAAIKNMDRVELALDLCDRGIDRNLKDKDGKTAIEILRPSTKFCSRHQPLWQKLRETKQ